MEAVFPTNLAVRNVVLWCSGRHIKQLPNCPMRGHDNETLLHSLMECDHARRFWEAAERFYGIDIPRLHPLSWSQDLLDQRLYKKDVAAIMITVMWVVWHTRNNYTHGELVYQPIKSMVIIEEIIRALEIPERQKSKITARPRWLPPDE